MEVEGSHAIHISANVWLKGMSINGNANRFLLKVKVGCNALECEEFLALSISLRQNEKVICGMRGYEEEVEVCKVECTLEA